MADKTTETMDEGQERPAAGTRALAERLGIPYLAAGDYPDFQHLDSPLSVNFMKQCKIFPLHLENDRLQVVMADPTDAFTLDAIRMYTGHEVEPYIGEESEIMEAIERFYGAGATTVRKIIEDMDEQEVEVISGPAEEDVDHLRDLASEAPVIRLVNFLVSRAAEVGASDVHFEPFEDRLVVRYRIDGVLHEVESPPKRLQPAIISRVKLMAKMNIAERRLPQDGRIRVRAEDREIDIRVSTIPTVFGESLVLRLLDKSTVFLSLEALGFESEDLSRFGSLIAKPYGMILVTGPTGSGKTTTLYAVLESINSTEKKVITIEDPVEYQVNGINQIQVMPKIGLSFANGLRSIVRQDPDVIMVGEIRDRETADIAVHASLTGHLVFSTVHTNDAASAITRLSDMGVESFLIASTVVGIVAQRLVRRVCPQCAVDTSPDSALLRRLGGKGRLLEGTFRTGLGCEFCNKTGFKGRIGIFEHLVLNEELRKLVLQQTSSTVIREAAVRSGMRTLREDGLEKARLGTTTLGEVLRVTQDE